MTLIKRFIKIHWDRPLKHSPLRYVLKVLVLALGSVFLIRAIEGQFNPLPEMGNLNRFEGVVKEVKYLGKSRRGFITIITLENGHQEISFKTYYGKEAVDWISARLNKPTVALWRDELTLIRFGYLPVMWSLKIEDEAYLRYSKHYKIDKRMRSFDNSGAIFWLFFFGYFLISNYRAYKKPEVI